MNAVDTNIFVYALDADEPAKQAKAGGLLSRLVQQPAETVLLWQVAGELLNCLRKWESAGRMSAFAVESNFRNLFLLFPLQVPSASLFEIAFELRSGFSLSHWNSLLLAACKTAAVDTLYSEDHDAGTDYRGVKVVNPFA